VCHASSINRGRDLNTHKVLPVLRSPVPLLACNLVYIERIATPSSEFDHNVTWNSLARDDLTHQYNAWLIFCKCFAIRSCVTDVRIWKFHSNFRVLHVRCLHQMYNVDA
jgi:hypothetical protein